ncbi:MAG: HEAT repeat domain-containing protein [Porticoccaceae bacterium]
MSNFTDPLLISIEQRLQDEDPGIRRVAVMDLVDSPEPEAVELLIAALSDTDENVRMEAAKVIDEFEASACARLTLIMVLFTMYFKSRP